MHRGRKQADRVKMTNQAGACSYIFYRGYIDEGVCDVGVLGRHVQLLR